MEDKDGMIEYIKDYLSESDCEFHNCDCDNCDDCSIEICYSKACDRLNHEFAKSIDYGGCDTEEEFWEQLMD